MTDNNWNVAGTTVNIYHHIFIPAMIGEWAPRVLALANPQPGEDVLDVACGTGVLTRAAAQAVGISGRVIGVDINPEMLAMARQVSDSRFHQIEWREGSAQQLPFDSASFDVVFCQLGLMFFPDRPGAVAEMRRVLRSGGRLAVMVWGAIEKCPGQMAMAKTWEKLFGENEAAGFYRQHSMSNPEKLHSLLAAAGFQKAWAETAMGTMRFPSAEHLVRSYGALGRFPADESQKAAAIQEVTQMLQAYTSSDGLAYPIEAVLGKGRN